MRARSCTLFIFALAWVASAPGLAASVEERLTPCLSCHGQTGQSKNPEVPSLGAQPAAYLVIQLYLFREKLRPVPLMIEMTKDLSDDDLQKFADSIAALPAPQPPLEPPDAARMARARALVQQNRCGFCHSPDFAGHDNIARLAGQREDYLAKALREYKSNTRPGYDASMAEVVQPIGDTDIADIAYFMAHARP
jgi:cytochrome c553